MRIRVLTAAAAAMLAAASAQAASFGSADVLEGTGNIVGDAGAGTLTTTWSSTKFTATIDFTVESSFDFFFLSYSGTGADQSGYTLDLLDEFGDAVVRYTTTSTACNSAASPVSDAVGGASAGACQLIGSTTSATRIEPDAGTSLFGELAAGDYRFGFYESAQPTSGSVVFGITENVSEVPLPAAGSLLVAALAGLGFLRRRA